MVQIKDETITITINSPFPVDTITNYQKALIAAIQHYNSEGDDGTTIYFLGDILEALMPTFEQGRFMYSIPEPALQE